jgi:hypothetical protein
LQICELQNQPVDTEKIPVEFEDFLIDTQIAMNITHTLPDKIDSNSGSYLGKDLSILPFLLDLYEIKNKKDSVMLIMRIVDEVAKVTNEKLRQRTKK